MTTRPEDLQFPSVSGEGIPEDRDALCAILAGQRGLAKLYETLEETCEGESRFLVGLLRRDWLGHLNELVVSGEDVLSSLGCAGPERVEILPDAEEISALAAECAPATPERVVEVVREFGARALFCYTLVPWTSDNPRVFEHFSACLLAEDAHLGTVDLFRALLTDPGPASGS